MLWKRCPTCLVVRSASDDGAAHVGHVAAGLGCQRYRYGGRKHGFVGSGVEVHGTDNEMYISTWLGFMSKWAVSLGNRGGKRGGGDPSNGMACMYVRAPAFHGLSETRDVSPQKNGS